MVLGSTLLPSARADTTLPPRNAGFGAVEGPISYNPPLPMTGSPCSTTVAFTLGSGASGSGWASVTLMANTVLSAYAGTVTITGTGTAGTCESYTLGGGTMTVSLTGSTVNESALSCQTLSGTYSRVLSTMTMDLQGDCTVNNYGSSHVTFVATVQLVPSRDQTNTLTPITSAEAAGSFVVAPV